MASHAPAAQASPLALELLREWRAAFPELRASATAADRLAYARDLWPRHHLTIRHRAAAELPQPALVLWPESTQQVAQIVEFARASGTAIVPYGAGSGVCGGILPSPRMVVIDMKRMASEVAFAPDEPSVTVQTGMMGVPFEESLERRGFSLGHFPSSILCSTVGGWLAARSAGQCSGRYGKIEDMVLELECVTGTGEVLVAKTRSTGPSLVPLLVGSEGTLAVLTRASFRLHEAPGIRAFAAYEFRSTDAGWEGMRRLFQAGLRPAVSRLYDPFDAMLARQGSVKREVTSKAAHTATSPVPGLGASLLRTLVGQPALMNAIIDGLGTRLMGPAQLVLIFEGESAQADAETARSILEAGSLGAERGSYVGEGPAQKWLRHRYAVSYRQAPVFMADLFSDTIEVASTWDALPGLYHGVRKALGRHVFVMAHLSHAYPDGCCIYFSFAGRPDIGGRSSDPEAIYRVYDAAWRAALTAAIEAGGTIAHHHGVGRSKAPLLEREQGASREAFAALKRVFDPAGILNPGNLVGHSGALISGPVHAHHSREGTSR